MMNHNKPKVPRESWMLIKKLDSLQSEPVKYFKTTKAAVDYLRSMIRGSKRKKERGGK